MNVKVHSTEFGVGITTNNTMMISLHDKKTNFNLKFDSGDYIFMKNRIEYEDFFKEINSTIFDIDKTDQQLTQENINKILNY